jgi:hypothetical protein
MPMKTSKLLMRGHGDVKVLVPPSVWVVTPDGTTVRLHASTRRIPDGYRAASPDETYAAAQAYAYEVTS